MKTLTEIDPSNSTKYQTIAQEESKERWLKNYILKITP